MVWFRQMIRGCGTLPHVGEHPGLVPLLAFTGVGAIIGAVDNGLRGALLSAAFVIVPIGLIFLLGAIDRANTSDAITRSESPND